MPDGYTYALSAVASEYAFRLPKRQQRRLAGVCRLLADSPSRLGNYTTTDDRGRILQNLTIDDWTVTYWTDHAVKEVRIVEVVQI